MSTHDKFQAPTHTEATSLAWYVTGQLSESERHEFTRHLESCAECQAELQSMTELKAELRDAFDAQRGPSPRARTALLAQLEAAAPSHVDRRVPPAKHRSLLEQLSVWLRAPLVPRWAPAAALVLILVQAGLLLRMTPNPGPPASEVATRGLATSATRLTIVFNPLASETQIRELLTALGARIVDGPTAAGRYTIEITAADPKTVSEKLRAARAHSDILQSLDIAPP